MPAVFKDTDIEWESQGWSIEKIKPPVRINIVFLQH